MRLSLFFVLPLLCLSMGCSVGPASRTAETETEETTAEPESNLLADILARDADFTGFVDALESTGLGDVLRGDGPFTVFAPSDSALALLGGIDLSTLPEETLVDFLKYHIIVGELTGNGTENTPWASTLGSERLHFSYESQMAVIDGLSQISRADSLADNGRFHRVDLPLLPDSLLATLSIAEVVAASPRLAKLEEALSQANLLSALDTTEASTLFAPSDVALRGAPVSLDELDEAILTKTLNTHTVEGALDSDALSELDTVTTLSGQTVSVQSDPDLTLNEEVNIVWEDIALSNGVIHIVDGLLSLDDDS